MSAKGSGITPADSLKAALARHLDEPPPTLGFNVPLDRLIDSHYCQTLETDLDKLNSDGWEEVKATPGAWQMIPDSPGLYMFVWRPMFEFRMASAAPKKMATTWILYVGRAGDANSPNTLRKRYKGEYAKLVGGDPELLWSQEGSLNREKRFSRYLCVAPLWFWYIVANDVGAIPQLESRLFNLFAPPLNAHGGPRLRPAGKPKKAF